jgi:hypothetical protein
MNAEIELKNDLKNILPDEAIVHFAGKEYIQNIGKSTFEIAEVRQEKAKTVLPKFYHPMI